jgi:hypothetical protein
MDMTMFRNMMKKETSSDAPVPGIKILETNAENKPGMSFKNLAIILSKEKPIDSNDGNNIAVKVKKAENSPVKVGAFNL